MQQPIEIFLLFTCSRVPADAIGQRAQCPTVDGSVNIIERFAQEKLLRMFFDDAASSAATTAATALATTTAPNAPAIAPTMPSLYPYSAQSVAAPPPSRWTPAAATAGSSAPSTNSPGGSADVALASEASLGAEFPDGTFTPPPPPPPDPTIMASDAVFTAAAPAEPPPLLDLMLAAPSPANSSPSLRDDRAAAPWRVTPRGATSASRTARTPAVMQFLRSPLPALPLPPHAAPMFAAPPVLPAPQAPDSAVSLSVVAPPVESPTPTDGAGASTAVPAGTICTTAAVTTTTTSVTVNSTVGVVDASSTAPAAGAASHMAASTSSASGSVARSVVMTTAVARPLAALTPCSYSATAAATTDAVSAEAVPLGTSVSLPAQDVAPPAAAASNPAHPSMSSATAASFAHWHVGAALLKGCHPSSPPSPPPPPPPSTAPPPPPRDAADSDSDEAEGSGGGTGGASNLGASVAGGQRSKGTHGDELSDASVPTRSVLVTTTVVPQGSSASHTEAPIRGVGVSAVGVGIEATAVGPAGAAATAVETRPPAPRMSPEEAFAAAAAATIAWATTRPSSLPSISQPPATARTTESFLSKPQSQPPPPIVGVSKGSGQADTISAGAVATRRAGGLSCAGEGVATTLGQPWTADLSVPSNVGTAECATQGGGLHTHRAARGYGERREGRRGTVLLW